MKTSEKDCTDEVFVSLWRPTAFICSCDEGLSFGGWVITHQYKLYIS